MKPQSIIKVKNKIIVDYEFIHQYNQILTLDDGSTLQCGSINFTEIEIFDEISETWKSVKKWKQYLQKKYISRSSSLKGKNNWSKGRIPPHTGLTYEEFYGIDKTETIKKKLSKKTKQYFKDEIYEESRKNRSLKLSETLKGRSHSWNHPGMTGKTHSEETKKNLSEKIIRKYLEDPNYKEKIKHIGEKNGMFNKTHSEVTRSKISYSLKHRYANDPAYKQLQKMNGARSQLSQNRKKSKPEQIVENLLIENNIEYICQYLVSYYAFDFYIPNKNTLIEVQGDYWHGNPLIYKEEQLNQIQINKQNSDINKYNLAIDNGFNVCYIWENEIKKQNFIALKEIIHA